VTGATHITAWSDPEVRLHENIGEGDVAAVLAPRFTWGRIEGSPGQVARWSGYSLAIAWEPTYAFFYGGGSQLASAGRFNPLGMRASFDVGRMSAGLGAGLPPLRISVGWLPYVNSLPTVVSLGVGCVFN
jgi:hypothetical protein